MEITLYDNYTNDTRKIFFDYEKIISDLKNYQMFKDEESELSLILVDSDEIRKINKEYRKRDYVTDVISFEAEFDEFEEDDGYIGDIFLCIDKALEQAKSYGHSIEREFAFLLCHGILHLHGYDHMEEEDEKVMFAKQDEILNALNYKR